MDDQRTVSLAFAKYPDPSSTVAPAAGPWKASLMEKMWIVLMAAALTVAAISATAADRSGPDEPTDATAQVMVGAIAR